jgi:DNA-directed RNA polymerase specialized sigma subunit
VRKRNPWYEEPIEDSVVERALPEAADAERRLAAKELLAKAMARLEAEQSERGRRLAELIFKDGLTNPEIVSATGLKTDAVYQWRSRLTRALRKHIDTLMAEEGSR